MVDQALTTEPGERLRQLIGGYEDEKTLEKFPGLLAWYPTVVAMTAVRTGKGGTGSGGNVPVNTATVDLVSGSYWSLVDVPMPDTEQARNPDNYRPGLEVTVLGLADSVRRAMRIEPAVTPRKRGPAHTPRPDVLNALRWLHLVAGDIELNHPAVARTVNVELLRIWVKVYGLVWGSSKDSTRSQCQHCYQPESVVSNGKYAACVTPFCRTSDGQRHCWEVLDGEWVAVEEPLEPGAERLSDDDLRRLTG